MKQVKILLRPRYLIVAALLLLLMLSGAVGKYVKTIQNTGKVTFTASLAESVVLQEHQAVRQEDGSYELGDTILPNDEEKGNMYTLIPGLDIPKDPYIVINEKTDIPAYLFLEVVDNTSGALTYNLCSCWVKTNLKTSNQTNGEFYVYSGDGTEPVGITQDYNKISILDNDIVYVSQTLLNDGAGGDLVFYAYLEEAAAFPNS